MSRWWPLGGMAKHLLDYPGEFFQARGRNDNRISVASDIFGDAKETSTGVLFEREYECFPFDLNLFGVKGFLVDGRARTSVARKTTWGPVIWRHNALLPLDVA